MNKKGFTLIEVIISLGLTSILMLLSFNIIFLNVKMFNKTEARIEIQEQAQFIKEFIENKLYLSSGVHSVINKDGYKIKSKDFKEGEIKELRFVLSDNVEGIYIDNKRKKMFYRRNLMYNGYEIGDYVKKFNIEKISEGKGVKIYLEMEKNKEIMNIEFLVYFRNYSI
ncbi:prepilin-type N-terminal cleavage/methylation domain-containing protein [Tepidibacter formicigenes]|jgi:prepilin-type N-terminal cleavage/methylation domain-containing protein|uniref:Prepilin-type N-terminal cleavage/methylation domain-containing protein n=1 Tax=Tepidibacter formicigenes DSM 15518 TaxID=1123349 RepID=A0A1M6PX55_9FIRM|nr:prepilin-type N-terminal cleavage/methylation domain-containing protein [Tepidibacter formicigenes]SHK12498.1 prepilin-type N-terminal cleavage/methylation domain-containing protein [Tepidibacter formicigenes DSM 15518]